MHSGVGGEAREGGDERAVERLRRGVYPFVEPAQGEHRVLGGDHDARALVGGGAHPGGEGREVGVDIGMGCEPPHSQSLRRRARLIGGGGIHADTVWPGGPDDQAVPVNSWSMSTNQGDGSLGGDPGDAQAENAESAGPSFADLGIDDRILSAIADVGYESPSPIQAATIPPLLEGADVVGLAQTGTGKT